MIREVGRAFEAEVPRISGILSAETGKNRLEAVGEVQEVLDMVTHYCDQIESNGGFSKPMKSTPAENNTDVLVPFGTFAVIVPFNFPVALAAGMMLGALVTGNTVVVKSSDKTPRSTHELVMAFALALPSGVVNLLHGGADVGKMLAATDVDGIAFTGSSTVGWELVATKSPTGLPRPVLAEMGGQNPAIVTRTANLDDAATGIAKSAYGLSGQKCSACRRVIVDSAVADDLIAKLKDKAEALVVGDPSDAASNLGPVIDDAIGRRIDDALALAQRDGRVVAGGRIDRPGNWFAPVLVADLPRGHELTREELFAPFLTVVRVDGLDEALAEANAVRYGLSAGIFTGEQAEVDQFLDEIEAGVLYVNRPAGATTGAWPGVQSFCGWKMSGSSGKGGLANWYLPGFMREQSRTVVAL
jgi:1-pyrroline-5-carboxylate dehydrogenase